MNEIILSRIKKFIYNFLVKMNLLIFKWIVLLKHFYDNTLLGTVLNIYSNTSFYIFLLIINSKQFELTYSSFIIHKLSKI